MGGRRTTARRLVPWAVVGLPLLDALLALTGVRPRRRSGATAELDARPVPAERVLLFADDPRAVVRVLRAPAAGSAA
jgi:hypothetical protein